MKPEIVQGLRWAAGVGLGVGLMLGAACSLLWKPASPTAAEVTEQTCGPAVVEAARQQEAHPSGPGGGQGTAGRTVAFSVLPGMSFQEIADLLQAAGAVTDREAFLERARELDALRRAQPGLYVLTQADAGHRLTSDEIIAQLIRGPSQ